MRARNHVLKSYFLYDLFPINTLALLSIVCQVVFDKSDSVKTEELCSFWADNWRGSSQDRNMFYIYAFKSQGSN